jgi:hypothetical protein
MDIDPNPNNLEMLLEKVKIQIKLDSKNEAL